MNTSHWATLAIGISLIAIAGVVMLAIIPGPKTLPEVVDTTTPPAATSTPPAATTTPSLADLIVVDSPKAGGSVGSTTLVATGKARGTWYFEASFPVQLLNASGTVIAQTPAQAQADWMTTAFVPFKVTLTYAAQPHGSHGTLVFKNDNPSGDPARDKKIEVPVVFN